jgi:hypothetical protein
MAMTLDLIGGSCYVWALQARRPPSHVRQHHES